MSQSVPLQYVIFFLMGSGPAQSSVLTSSMVITPSRRDNNLGSTATRIIGTLGYKFGVHLTVFTIVGKSTKEQKQDSADITTDDNSERPDLECDFNSGSALKPRGLWYLPPQLQFEVVDDDFIVSAPSYSSTPRITSPNILRREGIYLLSPLSYMRQSPVDYGSNGGPDNDWVSVMVNIASKPPP
ncbi:hypothetical protein EDD22DRAFT_1050227 [Suillus occidentalis]|nr:hypothetical protein EDD22DRAFT_1050227 [Suillus occidentalis]